MQCLISMDVFINDHNVFINDHNLSLDTPIRSLYKMRQLYRGVAYKIVDCERTRRRKETKYTSL